MGAGKEKIVIVGAGGHAKAVIDAVVRGQRREIIGIVDDDPAKHDKRVLGYRVVGSVDNLADFDGDVSAIISIGDNQARRKVAERALSAGVDLCNVIHPSSYISPQLTLGSGVFVSAGVTTHPDVSVADCVIIGMGASLSHDVSLKSFVHISPGVRLTGEVQVGQGSDLGANVVVVPGKKIGRNVIVGAGAVVLDDLPDNVVAVGVPARIIKERS